MEHIQINGCGCTPAEVHIPAKSIRVWWASWEWTTISPDLDSQWLSLFITHTNEIPLQDLSLYKDDELLHESLHLLGRFYSAEENLFEKATQTQVCGITCRWFMCGYCCSSYWLQLNQKVYTTEFLICFLFFVILQQSMLMRPSVKNWSIY